MFEQIKDSGSSRDSGVVSNIVRLCGSVCKAIVFTSVVVATACSTMVGLLYVLPIDDIPISVHLSLKR